MPVARARFLDLLKARCEVFATTFNPDGLRLGNKVLRQRLRGPALLSYYPRKTWTIREMNKAFGPYIQTYLEEEYEREEHLEEKHSRGKRAPKKKTEAPSVKKRK